MDELLDKNQVTFGIVIESNSSEQDLKQTLESIKNVCYPKSKLHIVISAKDKLLHPQILLNELEDIKQHGIKSSSIVVYADGPKEVIDKDTFYSIMTANRDYIIKINAGQCIDNDYFNFVHENDNLGYTVIEDINNDTVAIHYSTVNSSYLDFNDYDLMVRELVPISKNEKIYLKYDKKN